MIPFTLLYGAGLWTGLVFLVPLPVVLVTCALALVVASRSGWWGILAAVAACGGLTGSLARGAGSRACATAWSPGPQAAMIRVHDAPGARGVTSGTVLHAPSGCDGRLRVRLEPGTVPAGAAIVAVGTFRRADRGAGILRVEHARVLRGGWGPSWRFAVRERVAKRLRALYGDRAPLVHALVINRKEDLDRRLRQTFADAGLAHLLAISGLHVGILATWVQWLLRRAITARGAKAAGAIFAWGYVTFLGFPAPATRAAAFLTIGALGLLRQRHPSGDAVLVTAALLVLSVDPLAAADVGAWLSFAAVWGTARASRELRNRRSRVLRMLAVSAGATLATAPITAYAFGSVALIGIAANLVAIPLAAVAVPGVFASLLVGGPLAGGAGLALAGIEYTAGLAARVPGGCVTGVPGARFALLWTLILGCAVWMLAVRPAWAVVRRRVLLTVAAAAWIAAVLPFSRGEWGGGRAELEIHVLDVGQGDAIAVRTPRGRWLLIDGGPRTPQHDAGRSVVLPFLRSRGVRELDLVVASHGDADHLGGVPAIVRALTPDLVLEPGQPLATSLYLEHLAAVDEQGATWRAARAGDSVRIDGVLLAVLHPDRSWIATQLVPNENSVVFRLVLGGFEALFTGDIGAVVESVLGDAAGRADLLKVAHHGSAGGTTAEWLETVRPRAAVISVGANRYGHPDPGVLERLEERGIRAFRTDRGGTVTIRTDGRYFEIIQGGPSSGPERLACLLRPLLRSSGSSFSRNACTPARRESFPTSSTTSR